jgi:HEXXH motif-containing protein
VMRLYSIAKPEDLLLANAVHLRRTLREDAAGYAQMADGRVDSSFITAVSQACDMAADQPGVRAWSHTIDRLRPFREGRDVVPHSSAIGHLDADSPNVGRLIELLGWEICGAALPDSGEATFALPGAPPRVLPVGRCSSLLMESHWPTTGTWTLTLKGGEVELRGNQGSTERAVNGWLSPLVFRSRGLDAVVPLHQASLTNRDFQDFPIVRSRLYAEEWGIRIATSADTLLRYSASAGAITRAFVSSILPLVCGDDAIGSASRESALGLIFLPATDAIDQLTECLLHEAMHQYLFRIEECGAVFTDAITPDEKFYSPWRSDPRPLRMTLHGAFVFAAVADLYLWQQAPSALGIAVSECHRRAYHRSEQARVAIDIVRRHSELTRFGKVVVDAIDVDLATLRDRVSPGAEDRSDVNDQISSHLEKYGEYVR